jgi:hypothetical protein
VFEFWKNEIQEGCVCRQDFIEETRWTGGNLSQNMSNKVRGRELRLAESDEVGGGDIRKNLEYCH